MIYSCKRTKELRPTVQLMDPATLQQAGLCEKSPRYNKKPKCANRDTKASENKADKGGQIIFLRDIALEAGSRELLNQIA